MASGSPAPLRRWWIPVHGGDVVLTLDSDLQWYVLQQLAEHGSRLGAEHGSAMVVRVSDGHILAAADWPTFDPNDFSQTPSSNTGARVFSSPYEPGSIMKAVGVAMLIDGGYTYAEDKIVAPGFFRVYEGRFIKNFSVAQDTQLTTAGVLYTSSNRGLSVLSSRMPSSSATEYFRNLVSDRSPPLTFWANRAVWSSRGPNSTSSPATTNSSAKESRSLLLRWRVPIRPWLMGAFGFPCVWSKAVWPTTASSRRILCKSPSVLCPRAPPTRSFGAWRRLFPKAH